MQKKPAYQHHKATGQARVTINGKDHYLGPHDSEESHQKYDDLIADWLAEQGDPSGLTVGELALLYLAHARVHYRKDGEETSEDGPAVDDVLRLLLFRHD